MWEIIDDVPVEDGFGGSDFINYTLVVSDVNDGPEWDLLPKDQNISADISLSYGMFSIPYEDGSVNRIFHTTFPHNVQ